MVRLLSVAPAGLKDRVGEAVGVRVGSHTLKEASVKFPLSWSTIAVSLTMLAADAAATPIVADGGFENLAGQYSTGSIGAWTFHQSASPSGIYTTGQFPGADVTEGSLAFDMGMAGFGNNNSLSQVIQTVAGRSYRLTFDWGSEYDWGTHGKVTVGNLSETLVDAAGPNTPNSTGTWIQHSADFVFVANGDDTLQFEDLSTAYDETRAGLTLDNVVVIAVDDPPTTVPDAGSTVSLLAFGLATLAAARRRPERAPPHDAGRPARPPAPGRPRLPIGHPRPFY